MKKHLFTRMLSLLLVAAMLAGFAMPVQAAHDHAATETAVAEGDSLSFTELENSVPLELLHKAEETEEEPLYDDTDIVRVSIVLDKESTVESGFSTEDIALNAEAMRYRDGLKADQEAMTASIASAIGQELDVVWNLTLVANVISANVEYGQIEAIEAVGGVKEVFLETRYDPAVVETEETVDPNMATSGNQIGSNIAWANGYTGAGSRIAVIDTGIDSDHQSMDAAAFEYALQQNATAKGMEYDAYVESLNLLDAEEIAGLMDQLHVGMAYSAEKLCVNSKIAFGYNYIDENLDIVHDNDSQGSHGSHVSGIATANKYIPNGDGTFSKALDTVYVQGVAPDAQLITMKVFGTGGGAYDTDYMVAIEDAIILGADAVNLSLGSASHGFVTNSGYQELLESLTKNGTVAVMSGGNNGYWSTNSNSPTGLPFADDINFWTGGAPGSVVNSLGVASVQNSGNTGIFVQVGDSKIVYNDYTKDGWTNSRMTTVGGDREYLFIDGIGTAEDWAVVGDALKGKIAICSRGTTSFFEKGIAAVNAGAIATIIYNNQDGTINMDLTDYTKTEPCVSITQADGALIKSLSTPVTDEAGNVLYYTGKMLVDTKVGTTVGTETYYTMSSFSSWGVPTALILKPEITAPGGNIYSLNGVDTSGKAYENNSGTSMSAPQVSGMVALIGQYIRETELATKTGLSNRQLAHSLLMSTAVPIKEKASGGNYYSVLNQGSGLANVGAAVTSSSYILMNADATVSYADGKVKAELGDDPNREGRYSFSFTLNNFSQNTNTYTLRTDLFTQAITESDGIAYLSTMTTLLAANVTYKVDGVTFTPSSGASCDLDKDGDTDADDAQYLLDYTTGKLELEAIDPIADVNRDGAVNTYDAHLILAGGGTSEITVPAGGKVEIAVEIVLPETVKANLDASYVNGAYLEGYVFVEPTSSVEGVLSDVVHSIPVLGFYGNWTDPSMFDKSTYADRLYGDTTPTYLGVADANALTVKFDGDANTYYMVGNPFFTEESYPADRIAIGNSTTLKSWKISLVRNAAALASYVVNEAGEVVYVSTPTLNTFGAYYYTSGAAWRNTSVSVGINKPVSKLDVKEGERITVGVVAIPEYYAMNGALTANDIQKLLEDGTLGKGATLTTSMTVDNTAPVVKSVTEDLENNKLIITARDENYLAAVRVTNNSGSKILASVNPQQDGKGEEVTVTIDLNGVNVGRKFVVSVADYAGNMTTYKVVSTREPVDYTGQMFAWTRNGARRTQEEKDAGMPITRWMKIDPAKVWYNNDDSNFTGTTNFTATSYADIQATSGLTDHHLLAGDYVEGFVIFALKDGYLYGAPMDDLNDAVRLTSWKEVLTAQEPNVSDSNQTIYAMHLNYKDGLFYILDKQQNFYTFSPATLEMKYAFSLTLVNPAKASYNVLMDFAIHKDGTFYALNKPSVTKTQFLYKFTLDQVKEYTNEDGTKFVGIQDLTPINNDKNGYMSTKGSTHALPYNMTWDHDKEILYMIGTGAVNVTSNQTNTILYEIDVEEADNSPVNTYKPEGSGVGTSSLMFNYVNAMFIVPSKDVTSNALLPGNIATQVTVSAPRTDVLVTASMQFETTVYPWNLEDKSVTWRTSDESIATINEDGLATFHKTGNVTIIATSVAEPHVEGTYEVTVVNYPSTQLSAAITDSEGNTYMGEFYTNDLMNPALITKAPGNFLAGGIHEGKVYYHDGAQMYSVDPETHEFTNLGMLASSWQWTDIASAPHFGPEEAYLFDLVIGFSGNGTYIEMIKPETGTLQYFDLSSNANFTADPFAALCLAEPYADVRYPGYTYYAIHESGAIGKLSLYTETEGAGFAASATLGEFMYPTGIEMSGASTTGSGTYVSAYYDEATGYVLLTVNNPGEPAKLYAIDPTNGITGCLGSFSEDIKLVNGLYMWNRATELTVRTNVDALDLYVDEPYTVKATVLPQSNSQDVTWSSSDETVVKVDANGTVTPVGVGTATVTVTTVATDSEGKPATTTVTVNVKALTTASVKFNAQVTDENGNVYWAEIDTATMTATKLADATNPINAGGWHDGKIYGTDGDSLSGGYIYEIDPENGYTGKQGVKFAGSNAYVDGASAPLLVTDGLRSGYNGLLYETCDFSVNLTGSGALLLISDYTSSSVTGFNLATSMRGATAIALTGEIIYKPISTSTYLGYEYYILENDGDLHQLILYPTVTDGVAKYSAKFIKQVANVGIELPSKSEASMLYVEKDGRNYLLFSYSGNDNSELYLIDITSQYTEDTEDTITATKVGTMDGITDLTAIHIPTVVVQEEPIDPAGKMFTWTYNTTARFTEREKVNGLRDRWMIVDPDTLWLNTDKESDYEYTGTINYQATHYAENKNYVLAAEYVSGNVIFAHYDGYLYSAPITDLDNATQLLNWKESMATVNDMALNYQDGYLYLLDKTGNFYQYNVQGNTLTHDFSVNNVCPNATAAAYLYPYSFAIDDEGNFYAVNYSGTAAKNQYLYTWKLSDVKETTAEDGTVTRSIDDLQPINPSKEDGFTGVIGKAPCDMAWDHDKDILYIMGNSTGTSTANNGQNATALLYILNTTTGKATVCTDYVPEGKEGVETGVSGLMYNYTRGLFVVPGTQNGSAVTEPETSLRIVSAETEDFITAETLTEVTQDTFVPGTATTASTAIDLSTDISELIDVTTETAPETGSVNAIGGGEVVEPTADARAVTLKLDADSTNGKFVFTYDPTQIRFTSCIALGVGASKGILYSVHNNEDIGTVTFSYASAETIPAGTSMAMVCFISVNECANTIVYLDEVERIHVLDQEPEAMEYISAAKKHTYELVETVGGDCSIGGYKLYKCSVCGHSYKEEIPAGEHKYEKTTVEPTCTEGGYDLYKCSVCGDEYKDNLTEPKGHSWGEWTQSKAPTCTEKGEEKRTCSACGETETREVEATGHKYEKTTVEPTCTEGGYDLYTCSCGDSYKDNFTEAKGHTWGEWTESKAPTCTEKGEEKRICSACGETETREVAPTGHNYTAVVTEPTCTEKGYTTYTCSCGDSYKSDWTDALGHTWGEWTEEKAATCTETGTEKRTCNLCDATETRDIEAKGHNYTATVTEPTCTAYGYTTYTCDLCGHSYVAGYVPAKGHSYTAVVTEPTCTAYGYTTYTCACGHSYVSEYTAPLGHKYQKTVTEPTCTQMGYTTYTCSVCGDSYKSDFVSAKGHTFGDWVVTKAATCTENGVEARTCACGETEERAIRATGHSFGDWAVTKAATCTEKGIETRTCACGETEERTIKALGHDWSDWTVTKAATCTEEGTEERTCATCGETEKRTIDALGHNCIGTITAPTCTTEGYTQFTCTVCGYSYRENIVPALGHNYQAKVTAPTCTEDGYTTYTCPTCGDSYVSDYVDALGHVFSEWKVTKPATCTEDGVETRTCACGKTETRAIPATGHSFGQWTVTKAATCTEDGMETRTCACGETEERTIEALGHDVTSKVVEPTCTEEGYTEYTCQVCGYTYHEDIVPALGHDYEAVVTEPTCTEGGYTTYTCIVCGDSYVSDETAALGHDWGDWIVTAPATCFTDGEEVRTCATCGETETQVIEKNSDNCPSKAFTDLNTNQWYHEAVDYVLRNGLMNGVGEGKFAPNGTLTRAQLVTILYRLEGEPSVEGLDNPFTDVAAGRWYTNAIIWAANAGVVTGKTTTIFDPNGAITREQIATILYRYAGSEKVEGDYLSSFTDAGKVSAYAVDAMNWAIAAGLTNGMTETTLAPTATATRAQIATILMRYSQM